MDSSHQFAGHTVSGTGRSYGYAPAPTTPSEWLGYPVKFQLINSPSSPLSYPAKFQLINSPSSPLSTRFLEHDIMRLSSSQEFQDPTEVHSGRSLSHNSSFETVNSSSSNSPVVMPEFNLMSSQSEKHTLQEIETILMAPDAEQATTSAQLEFSKSRPRPWEEESLLEYGMLEEICTGSKKSQKTAHGPLPKKRDIRDLLIRCAEAIDENRLSEFEMLANEAEAIVSISGDPIQRLGAYMLEGLKARQEASGSAIYRSLRSWKSESKAMLPYMQILYDICPYFKFGYMAANGAIAEAIRNEDRIHIIDFQIAQGTQWLTLIQALAARPQGPPRVRITGIDDPSSKHGQGDSLQEVERRLKALSDKFSIPLEFNAMRVHATEVTRDMLDIRPDEAIAVNFTLQLHHTPDESVDVNNPRDGLLRMVKGLSPRVTTLVEQESNMNTTPFLTRFSEAMDYYQAMFESIDETLPRDHRDRINVEQRCLAKDIVNIVACEGRERVERHELLGKWRSRLSMAGFRPCPLSRYVNSVIRSLLRCYSDNYTLVEKDGAMLLGWKNRHLISASAWH